MPFHFVSVVLVLDKLQKNEQLAETSRDARDAGCVVDAPVARRSWTAATPIKFTAAKPARATPYLAHYGMRTSHWLLTEREARCGYSQSEYVIGC